MQRKTILKYILDIEAVIIEIEELQLFSDNEFQKFSSNQIAIRAVERLLEIIGEAINNIKKIDSGIEIEHSREIIGLRNKIVHAYDSIDVSLLWGIILYDIPNLKKDIERLKSEL